MAIFNTTKDKNLIYIRRVDSTSKRNYVYDINTDTFTNVKTGNAVKTIPGLKTALIYYNDNSIAKKLLHFKIHHASILNFKEKIKLMDTVYSINPEAGYFDRVLIETALEDLRIVVKAYSKEINRYDFASFYFRYQEELSKQKLCKILSVDNLSSQDLEFLKSWTARPGNECGDSKILRLAYSWWKNEGEWVADGPYDFTALAKEFLNIAKTLNYIPQKLHFYEQFAKVRKTYRLLEDKRDEAILIEWYNQFNLTFSNDLFEVVIPQSKQDFVDEAAQQHNCVFRSYYPEVINKSTLIVFIRYKTNKDKSYITCEVSPSTGEICQYLKRYNERPTANLDKDAYYFEKAYQAFLDEQFNSSSN